MSKSKSVQQMVNAGRDPSRGAVPLGIAKEEVCVGDDIAYFWHTKEEFESTVDFLTVGSRSHDHFVILGRRAMNRRVCDHDDGGKQR